MIPKYIENIIKKFEKAEFEAYIVGGCVRDLLLGKKPKDWDITTNAKPEEILKIFPDSVYENKFGTVGVKIKEKDETIAVVEITTYRTEARYSDKRHPDRVKFTNELKKDLSRRDFTVNAMAIKLNKDIIDMFRAEHWKTDKTGCSARNIGKQTKQDVPRGTLENPLNNVPRGTLKNLPSEMFRAEHSLVSLKKQGINPIIDYFNGQKDLKNGIIKAVGNADKRFNEDALRMMRAIRFTVVLGFKIEKKTFQAIQKNSKLIKKIANERIKDEFIKILQSDQPDFGVILLRRVGILRYILPELESGVGISQNKHHIYTVFQHLIKALKYCPSADYRVRLAALFHDIAKPQTKRGGGINATFYNHDVIGAKISAKIMKRLAFSKEDIENVAHLIKNHMFYYNVDEVSEAGVRRLIKKVGIENIKDLMDLRIADRLGSGCPKAKPYKLRHLEYLIDKVGKDPISVKMLKINGDDLIKSLKMAPGPKIGAILDCLLSETIENPQKNTKVELKKRAKDLNKMDLNELRIKAKTKIEEKKEEDDKEIKQKHWIK
ncbi:MAG: CCA tRNA nucleotidyltransferase [Patescibacteria group bacterium]|nr:CCA tRNA nucleotidyltransferase [Patescibacteria group bacterium]